MSSRVVVSIRVPCSPIQAFEVFTEEIADWWQDSELVRVTPHSPGVMAFEPPAADGTGGRLVEKLKNGKVFEIGDVRAWTPGELLVVGWRHAAFGPEHATEVEVRFEPAGFPEGAETRVTVEHRGWDSVPQSHVARHGFPLPFFYQQLGDQWKAGLGRLGRIALQRGPATNPSQ
jgi:hypothetical protein